MKGISKIVATIALLAMVIAGIGAVWYVFSNNLSAFSGAEIFVNVRGSYNGTHAILRITIKNSGGAVATIYNVVVDDVDITSSLGISGYQLAPGMSIQKVIITNSIGPGNHIIRIVYEDRGEVKEDYSEFSI